MPLVRYSLTRLSARVVFTANAIMNLQARLNSIFSRVSTTVSEIQHNEPPNHDMDGFDLVSQ